jgi:hypothetical protein
MQLREYYCGTELRIRCPIGGAVDKELQNQVKYCLRTGHNRHLVTVYVVEGELEDCFPPSVCRPSEARRLLR